MVRHECPCKNCENQGCGAYHDKCELFLNWKQLQAESKGKPDIYYSYMKERDTEFLKGKRRVNK